MRRNFFALLLVLLVLLTILPVRTRAAERQLVIGFIDSGVSSKHIDPARVLSGRNYVFPEKDTSDRIGHGTATAGMVLGAAEQGVTGVCPDVCVVPLTVVDVYPSGVVKNGGTEALCAAIYDAVDEFGCTIVNMSLSAAEDSEELREAVRYAERRGVLLVSAVGNSGAEGAPVYPAAYDTVLAVGAADAEAAAAFSQSGADLLAPGVGLAAATHRNCPEAASVSGTSYACAVVTGLCARLLRAYPDLTPRQLRAGACLLARDILEPGFDARSGWGVLDAGTEIPVPFLDVPAEHAYRDGILAACEAGWMQGVGGGRFAPDATLTRAMLVTMLWRMEGEPEAEQAPAFTDIAAGTWYEKAVAWAAEEGIVMGFSAARFAPDAHLQREQLAVILYRYARSRGLDGSMEEETPAELVERADISAWAADAVLWAVRNQMLVPAAQEALSPRAPVCRGEAAETLARFLAMRKET